MSDQAKKDWERGADECPHYIDRAAASSRLRCGIGVYLKPCAFAKCPSQAVVIALGVAIAERKAAKSPAAVVAEAPRGPCPKCGTQMVDGIAGSGCPKCCRKCMSCQEPIVVCSC